MSQPIKWAPGALSRQKGEKTMAQMAISTKISPETYAALEAHAKASGKSKASIVEAALVAYLSKKGGK